MLAILNGAVAQMYVAGGTVLAAGGASAPKLWGYSQVAINAWQGKVTEAWFRQVLVPFLQRGGLEFIGEQVVFEVNEGAAVEAQFGRRIVDFLFAQGGRYYSLDIKSTIGGFAPTLRTEAQLAADGGLLQFGGRIVGGGVDQSWLNRTLGSVVPSEMQVFLH